MAEWSVDQRNYEDSRYGKSTSHDGKRVFWSPVLFLHYRLWPLHSILFWKRIETSWLSSLPLEQIYMQHFFGWKRPFRKANRLKFLALDVYELLEKSNLIYEMTSFIMGYEKFWTMKLKSYVTKWNFEKVAKVPPWRWFPRA